MSSLNINMYEKILKRIRNTTINESVEKLKKNLDDAKKDIQMFIETIQNIEDLRDEYNYSDYSDDTHDEYQEYLFVLNSLDKKKNIVEEQLKNTEEKYNIALEDKEIIDFLENIIL